MLTHRFEVSLFRDAVRGLVNIEPAQFGFDLGSGARRKAFGPTGACAGSGRFDGGDEREADRVGHSPATPHRRRVISPCSR